MKFLPILSVAFSFLLAFSLAAIEIEDGVLVLTDSNFDEGISQNSHILVEFYAPWCGHCKNLAPEYVKAAESLKGETAKLAKVDATVHKEVASKYAVQGFPTLKFFKNGKASDYQGGRTAAEIVTWLKKKSGPVASTISSEDDLLHLQEANEVSIVGVFDSESSNAAKAFLAAADADDSLVYAISTSAAVRSKLAVTGDAVVLLKDFDEGRADLAIAASTTADDIGAFATANSVPLIQTFSQEGAQKIFKSAIKVHSLFFTVAGSDHHSTTIDTFTEVAKENKGKTLFINVPSTESRVLEYFGFKESDLPAYVIADMGGKGSMKKYNFQGAITKDSVNAFVNSYFAGTLTPSLKSEEPAPEDTAGPVVVLKGKSFKQIVVDNNKDVLVEFYAPWCGHCKNLAPIYDELGEKVKGNSNLVIAKIDATANEVDIPGVDVSGFPTLYFFPGDKKDSPKLYDGGRDLEGFLAYLKKNAHHPVTHEEL